MKLIILGAICILLIIGGVFLFNYLTEKEIKESIPVPDYMKDFIPPTIKKYKPNLTQENG